jgi:hypothetical protein
MAMLTSVLKMEVVSSSKNVHLQDYTVSQSKQPLSEYSSSWEPQQLWNDIMSYQSTEQNYGIRFAAKSVIIVAYLRYSK